MTTATSFRRRIDETAIGRPLLNQRTWELGEIAEAFLEEVGAGRYLELHVTPENQRLQLLFCHGDIEQFRAGEASLESFLVDDPHWVASETAIAADFWAMRTILPASIFGGGPLVTDRRFLGMFCRYDCDLPESPVLSATAPLTGALIPPPRRLGRV